MIPAPFLKRRIQFLIKSSLAENPCDGIFSKDAVFAHAYPYAGRSERAWLISAAAIRPGKFRDPIEKIL
jgi:hypothetical protein